MFDGSFFFESDEEVNGYKGEPIPVYTKKGQGGISSSLNYLKNDGTKLLGAEIEQVVRAKKFSEGLSEIQEKKSPFSHEGKISFMGEDGETAFTLDDYHYGHPFDNGKAVLVKNGAEEVDQGSVKRSLNRVSLVDKQGNIQEIGLFSTIWDSPEGVFRVESDVPGYKKDIFFDSKGVFFEIKDPYHFYRNFHEGKAILSLYHDGKKRFVYLDRAGKISEKLYINASDFSEELAFVEDIDGNKGYIDKDENMVIVGNFTHGEGFKDGFAVVSDDQNSDYIIDKRGVDLLAGKRFLSIINLGEGLFFCHSKRGEDSELCDFRGRRVGK